MEVARRLSRVNGKWTNDGSRVRVGHFELADRPLTLADSCGNAFVVVLRGLHLRAASTDGRHGEEAGEVAAAAGCDEGEIKRVCAEAVDKICTSGFVNYFGLQRFGTNVHVPTHALGGSLLCRKYVDALVGVLSPRQAGLKPAVARALQAFEATVDAKAAIKLLPKRGAAAPHRLLTAFSDAVAGGMPREQAAVAALRRLPRRQLLMYVNALQALAFNRAASRRLGGDSGLDPQRPVAGDLVWSAADGAAAAASEDPEEAEAIGAGVGESLPPPSDAQQPSRAALPPNVRTLTAEEAASGSYSLADVLLPLPGHAVTYPAHAVADQYCAALREFGVECGGDWDGWYEPSLFDLPGGYRPLLAFGARVQADVVPYGHHTETLESSDLDRLEPRSTPSPQQGGGGGGGGGGGRDAEAAVVGWLGVCASRCRRRCMRRCSFASSFTSHSSPTSRHVARGTCSLPMQVRPTHRALRAAVPCCVS